MAVFVGVFLFFGTIIVEAECVEEDFGALWKKGLYR